MNLRSSVLASVAALALPLALAANPAAAQGMGEPMMGDPMMGAPAMGEPMMGEPAMGDAMMGGAMGETSMMHEGMMGDSMMMGGGTRLIEVTITNLTTGQGFSPSFIASHSAAATPLYELGTTASNALVSVAEGGNVGGFSGGAAGEIGGTLGDAVIAVHTPPGAVRTVFLLVDEAHPYVSGVWMLGMTNDGFGGFAMVDAYTLTAPVTVNVMGYDAGSEINNERTGFLGALGGGNMRDPENGVITIHTGIRGDADAPASWNFDPALVAQVTLTPVALAP